jgi:hypothetical protein
MEEKTIIKNGINKEEGEREREKDLRQSEEFFQFTKI